MTDIQDSRLSRRGFLARAAVMATVPTAAAILGPALLEDGAAAASADTLPSYAPVPPGSFGPALNADGYYVGNIHDNLYWVTDGFYQSMFLAAARGVVAVDAPPTIGHNLLRAIDQVTAQTGTPSKVTHLVYSHSHADHIGASSIFGDDVVRVGHVETGRLLREAGDPNRPPPTLTFTGHRVLEFGQRSARTRVPRAEPLAGQHLRVRAEASDADGRRRALSGLGAVQEPGPVAGHPRMGEGARHRHGLRLDHPRRRSRRSPRRSSGRRAAA